MPLLVFVDKLREVSGQSEDHLLQHAPASDIQTIPHPHYRHVVHPCRPEK